jgi:RNA polymerase sigma-70 factor, ECF subfamily
MCAKDDADRATVTAIVEGNRQALAALYRRHAPDLLGYLAHLTGSVSTAEDLVQELFVIVWRDAGRYRGESSVRSWLFGIAHNLALMALRDRHRETLDEAIVGGLASPAPGPAELADLALDRERLVAALATLSIAQRAVVELTFYFGLAQAETARVLGCPLGTVKSRLHYALLALARALERYPGASDGDQEDGLPTRNP